MKKLIAVILLAAGSMFGQVSVGIRLGQPPAPRVVRVRPNSPGPGYNFVDGYWYPQGNRYTWHNGYWTQPPYEGSNWVNPRYAGGMYYEGYWGGSQNDGHLNHDHRWDRDKRRDQGRYPAGNYNNNRDNNRR